MISIERTALVAGLFSAALLLSPTSLHAAGARTQADPPSAETTESEKKLSPLETMNTRHPQPVRVGDLIGLPLLDWNDSTIGYIEQVVRTPDGRIQLIVPYRSWFGWIRNGRFVNSGRPVAVPLETVAILARQVDLLDLTLDELAALPSFSPAQAAPIPVDEIIRIAITRR